MQGTDILKALRRLPALYLTPILMLSAKGGEVEIDAAMGAGANDYLVKPFEPEELVQRVADVLRNNSFAAQATGRDQK
jgi:DNA-binding response OmpR family regulator